MPKLSLRGAKPQSVLAPMTTYSSLPDGNISPDELPFLRRRAEGGFDWIMTAACCVHPSGWAFNGQWQCSGDEYLDSLRSVADAIHAGGAKAILQIHHGGRQSPSAICGVQRGDAFSGPVSASAIPSERPNAETPRELTVSEIETLIQSFADAARRARDTGYDGVEIHGANTYLLQQFVSPHSNRRTDEYGQDRLPFSERVTRAVVEAVGEDIAVGYRFSPEELENPGIRIADTLQLLTRLMQLDLDFLHISLGKWNQSSIRGEFEEPVLKLVADHIAGRVPLIGVGSVQTLADWDGCLALGAHSVAVGRMGIIDPDWPKKALTGEPTFTRIPKEGAGEKLVLPKGLADKIYQVAGWFPIEE